MYHNNKRYNKCPPLILKKLNQWCIIKIKKKVHDGKSNRSSEHILCAGFTQNV